MKHRYKHSKMKLTWDPTNRSWKNNQPQRSGLENPPPSLRVFSRWFKLQTSNTTQQYTHTCLLILLWFDTSIQPHQQLAKFIHKETNTPHKKPKTKSPLSFFSNLQRTDLVNQLPCFNFDQDLAFLFFYPICFQGQGLFCSFVTVFWVVESWVFLC